MITLRASRWYTAWRTAEDQRVNRYGTLIEYKLAEKYGIELHDYHGMAVVITERPDKQNSAYRVFFGINSVILLLIGTTGSGSITTQTDVHCRVR